MNILGICESPDILKVMRLIVLFINIIKAVVPIILILTLMIRLLSAVTKGNEDALASIKKTAPSNIVAAVLIFLVPTLVGIVTKISFPNSDYAKCIYGINNATIVSSYETKAKQLVSKVEETLNINDYINAVSYLTNIKDEKLKKELTEKLDNIKEKIDGTGKPVPVEDDNNI